MRFATSDLPAALTDAERAAAWAAALGAAGGQFTMRTPRVENFFGAVEVKSWGDLRLGVAIASSFDLERTVEHIAADGLDDVSLLINRGHTLHRTSQLGREVEINPGGLALFDLTLPGSCRAPDGGHVIQVMLPRRAFDGLDIRQVVARPLNGRSEAGRLLREVVASLFRRDLSSPGLVQATIAYLAVLLRNVIDAGECEVEHPFAINHARLRQARTLIEERFAAPEFSLTEAAEAIGVSRRHLQALFAREGETFSDCLAARRLSAAYLALRRVGGSDTIADVAHRCGFADLSTFYRRFGARYGRPPAQVRAEHGLNNQ